jgi:hypothetical protein
MKTSNAARRLLAASRLRILASSLVMALALAPACKSPRTSPHRVAEDNISGVWRAGSTEPEPIGWSLRLDQADAGNLEGRGSLTRAGGTVDFAVRGLRGPRDVKLQFDLDTAAAEFEGSVTGPEMIVGRVFLDGDTINVTFERD